MIEQNVSLIGYDTSVPSSDAVLVPHKESGSECEEEEDGEVVKSKGGEEVDEEEEGEAGVRSGGGGGFGGIVIGSVEVCVCVRQLIQCVVCGSSVLNLAPLCGG